MNVNIEIQKLIEKLTYNEAYAPDYPSEDKTNLEKEESQISTRIEYLIVSTRREDIGDWLRLGRSSIEEAFMKLRSGNRIGSVRICNSPFNI